MHDNNLPVLEIQAKLKLLILVDYLEPLPNCLNLSLQPDCEISDFLQTFFSNDKA